MKPSVARKNISVEHNVSREATKGSSVMVARIIELAVYRAQRTLAQEEMAERTARANETTRFHFWTGASGKRYVHSVYDLLECPPMPAVNYVLVRRTANGRAEALSIGRVKSRCPLAQSRRDPPAWRRARCRRGSRAYARRQRQARQAHRVRSAHRPSRGRFRAHRRRSRPLRRRGLRISPISLLSPCAWSRPCDSRSAAHPRL